MKKGRRSLERELEAIGRAVASALKFDGRGIPLPPCDADGNPLPDLTPPGPLLFAPCWMGLPQLMRPKYITRERWDAWCALPPEEQTPERWEVFFAWTRRGPRPKPKTQYDLWFERRRPLYHKLVRLPRAGADRRRALGLPLISEMKMWRESLNPKLPEHKVRAEFRKFLWRRYDAEMQKWRLAGSRGTEPAPPPSEAKIGRALLKLRRIDVSEKVA